MKKFSLLIMVFMLFCFALTACGTNSGDILGALSGSSNLISEQTSILLSENSVSGNVDISVNSTVNDNSTASNSVTQNSIVSNSTANSSVERNKSVAIALLIDRSSGMCGEEGDNGFTDTYGKTRLKVIEQAVAQALSNGTFDKNDYMGVIFFGGAKNTPIEATQLTYASNMIGISRAVSMDITSITGSKNFLASTEWRNGLEAATNMLKPFEEADTKHIIMITDGAGDKIEGESSTLDDYPIGGWKYYGSTLPYASIIPEGLPEKCYTDYIYDKYGISTSTINVGNMLQPAASYIEFMETASLIDGKDHYYYVETAEQIKDAVITECKQLKGKNTSSSNQASSKSSQSMSIEDGSLYIPQTAVPSGTSVNATMLIFHINGIGSVTPSNYLIVEDAIIAAEDFFENLTSSEKAEVVNYGHLLSARAALDKFKSSANK